MQPLPSLADGSAAPRRPLTVTQRSAAPARPYHEALDLTAGGTLADIHLNGQTYTLRITRAGKLILTK
jgi:hemin uptake protein HemP